MERRSNPINDCDEIDFIVNSVPEGRPFLEQDIARIERIVAAARYGEPYGGNPTVAQPVGTATDNFKH